MFRLSFAVVFVFIASGSTLATTNSTAPGADPSADEVPPMVVDGTENRDVFGFGRSVIIRGTVKDGAIAFGGDVIVEGSVEGDVAAFGGSVIQRDGARIGGDVFIFGGGYQHGKAGPLRNPSSMTFMYAGYEDEVRKVMRKPSGVLTPKVTPAYLGARTLGLLFWFVASLAFTAVTPGAVSRAVTRLQLTNVRVGVIGLLGSVVVFIGVPFCLRILPTVVGVLIGLMAILFLLLAYLFGRIVIHAATGRLLQRYFLSEGRQSESIALLIGATFWSVALSLPYVWPFVLAGLLITSLGLTLTARHRTSWKRPDVATASG